MLAVSPQLSHPPADPELSPTERNRLALCDIAGTLLCKLQGRF